ncbi:MAG: GDP-mannose mannosyl hydrolase [Methylovirgula sp.]
MTAGFLPDDDFAHIVRYAPLVSIDLILKDPDDRVLVGLRMNEPAKGTFFVPGGVIRKNETIEAAYARILKAETGLAIAFERAKLLGAYQHFYPTNRFGDPAYGTHYVVLAHELRLDARPSIELDSQHSHVRWMSGAEILAAPDVHANTQAYFR